ncbi:39S ribosomal protein L9, mitochondrial-like [Branchiostoma floridae]|uniref:Large ribosomal subunit protein bL9m n=1 Tax=Branchiostoma floridae TaxID=7739 RepID=A0A9J7MIS6_BRAFL|nr:39S ribosomal protein L9, mitochondrial-like [Branchiostoma floridae]
MSVNLSLVAVASRQLLQAARRSAECLSLQQRRTTYVLKRSHPLRLLKEGHEHRLKKMNKVYELVEETSSRDAKRKLELILTEDVPKMGKRGDVVHVRKQIGRNKLLATGLAVYASPENRQMFQDRKDEDPSQRKLSMTAEKTLEYLSQQTLTISVRDDWPEGWVMTKEHLAHWMKRKLLVVAPPHTITLPEEPVDRIGSYTFTVTINELESVEVMLEMVQHVPAGEVSQI